MSGQGELVELVEQVSRAIRPQTPRRPALLSRAARAGRVRGFVMETLEQIAASPQHAGPILRRELRQARHLHSAERRLVADGIYDLLRYGAVLDAVLVPSPPHADTARWLGWLVWQGLAVAEAQSAWNEMAHQSDMQFELIVSVNEWLPQLIADRSAVEQLALLGNVSMEAAQPLVEALGSDWPAFLFASNMRASVVLRTNQRRVSRDRLQQALLSEGIDTVPCLLASAGLRLVGRANLQASPCSRKGWFEVQDEGSQLITEVVAPDQGLVVDFCAGAGGKSLALADRLGPKTKILALDVRSHALEQLKRRARNAGVHVETALLPSFGPLPPRVRRCLGRAQRVLVDAPCTGVGVLRRHPETRLRLGAERLRALGEQQGQILQQAASLVAPSGHLIYATCSVYPAENEEVVDAFLADNPKFTLLPLAEVVGRDRAAQLGVGGVMRLAPHTHDTDGFYAAVLQRR